MRTLLQMLRLVFWRSLLQRVLTCIGIVGLVASSIHIRAWWLASRDNITPTFSMLFALISEGFAIVSAAGLLLVCVYWRVASAPRIVRLAPHGRSRLLGSVLALVLLIAVLWTVPYWAFLLRWTGPGFHPSVAMHLLSLADSAALPSAVVVGLFIASRSPLAALLLLIVLISFVMAGERFDVDLKQHTTHAARVCALLALIWIPFAMWYLNARRISPPRWLASGGQDVLATTVISTARPGSQREALERQLLGGTTAMQLGLQWFVVLGLLLGLQWALARVGEPSDPKLVARVMYASLCICPIVTTMVSFAAIRRSRTLWLLTGSSRGEFFACIDLILRRMQIVMVLVFAIWLVVLWFAQSWRPATAADQLGLAQFHVWGLWVLCWFAIYTQLAGWPRWLVALLAAGTLIALWQLSATPASSWSEAAARALAATVLLITTMVATIALRWHAQRRWREGDFPRFVTSTASGT